MASRRSARVVERRRAARRPAAGGAARSRICRALRRASIGAGAAAQRREVLPGELGVAELLRDFDRERRGACVGALQPAVDRGPVRRRGEIDAPLERRRAGLRAGWSAPSGVVRECRDHRFDGVGVDGAARDEPGDQRDVASRRRARARARARPSPAARRPARASSACCRRRRLRRATSARVAIGQRRARSIRCSADARYSRTTGDASSRASRANAVEHRRGGVPVSVRSWTAHARMYSSRSSSDCASASGVQPPVTCSAHIARSRQSALARGREQARGADRGCPAPACSRRRGPAG